MATTLMPNMFSNSVKNLRTSFYKGLDQEENTYTRSSNKINIQSTLILPAIDKNLSHKKLVKSVKQSEQYNVKEALKDWLIGGNNMNIETIIKNNQKYNQRDFLDSPLADESSQQNQIVKRRKLRSKRMSMEDFQSESQSTLDSSSNNNNLSNIRSYGSAQTIQLPKVLENINQVNQLNENNEGAKVVNNGLRRNVVKRVSLEINDDSPTSISTGVNSTLSLNLKSNRKEVNQNNRVLSSTNIFSTGSETKIQLPSKIELSNQYQSQNIFVPRYSSLQHIPINSNLLNEKIKTITTQQDQRRPSISPRQDNKKYVCQSMGTIPIPDNLKQNTPKSILKRNNKQDITLPSIQKKSVVFYEKVQQFEI